MSGLLKPWQAMRRPRLGLTLVETLIALALLGLISLSIANLLIKNNVTTASVESRLKEGNEVHAVIDDIRQDLLKGAYISPNSYDLRLEYTIPDSSGNASKKVYRIIASGTAHYLQLSTDGGTTWGSPYGLSAYTKYDVGSYAKFLYAGVDNNCTEFYDSDANGLWNGSGSPACLNKVSSQVLASPAYASKVDLRNFRFTTNTGSPVASFAMPYTATGTEWSNASMSWVASMSNSDVFLKVNPALVLSTVAPPSPYSKDFFVLQSFETKTANSMFGTDFSVRALAWDPSRRRLFIGGYHSAVDNQIFVADRNGVLIGDQLGLNTSDPDMQIAGLAVEENGKMLLALDATAKMVYRFNLDSSEPLSPVSTLDLTGSSLTILDSIAYDPSTPDDVYVVGWNNGVSRHQIWEINKVTGATVATWTIANMLLDPSHPPAGFFIEPLTGDFLVASRHSLGSAANPTLPIFRVDRTTSVITSTISFFLNDLSISSSDPDSTWGLAYDPAANHLFISSDQKNKVWEILPGTLITARQ